MRLTNPPIRGYSGVIDSLEFTSVYTAEYGLGQNGFGKLQGRPRGRGGHKPVGFFFDARATEEGIYSKNGYWTVASYQFYLPQAILQISCTINSA